MVHYLSYINFAKTTSIRLYILCKILPLDWKCSGHKILYTPQTQNHPCKVSQFKIFPPNTTATEGRMYLLTYRALPLRIRCRYTYTMVYILTYHFMFIISIAFLRTYAHLLLPKLPPFETFYAGVFYRSTILRRYPFIPSYLSYICIYVTVCIVKLLFLNYLELLRVVSWCGIYINRNLRKPLLIKINSLIKLKGLM